jgi:hypothetical protein
LPSILSLNIYSMLARFQQAVSATVIQISAQSYEDIALHFIQMKLGHANKVNIYFVWTRGEKKRRNCQDDINSQL